MPERTVIFGTSANPLGVHHLAIVHKLLSIFDRVIVIVCGYRTDTHKNDHIAPVHRATMADLTFGAIDRVEVKNFDLESDIYTPTYKLAEMFHDRGELWFAIGGDLLVGGRNQQSQIHRVWQHGFEVWESLNFVVVNRPGYPIDSSDYPPHHIVIDGPEGSSSYIRQRRFQSDRDDAISDLVAPEVEAYIARYGLYQGALPRKAPVFSVATPRVLAVVDEYNTHAVAAAARLEAAGILDNHHPNLITVFGGDGTMLRAIREHWRRRLPFLGVNMGTYGFLMNDYPELFLADDLQQEWDVLNAPLLHVDTTLADGARREDLAFNDAYLIAEPGKAGWTEVMIDGEVQLPRLVSDGILVATAAGSSAYARAMGAPYIPVGTENMVLVGSNVFQPVGWRPVPLYLHQVVQLRNVDPTPNHAKRPIFGFVDGVPLGLVESMTIRVSRVASAELAFLPGHHPRQKMIRIQFPKT